MVSDCSQSLQSPWQHLCPSSSQSLAWGHNCFQCVTSGTIWLITWATKPTNLFELLLAAILVPPAPYTTVPHAVLHRCGRQGMQQVNGWMMPFKHSVHCPMGSSNKQKECVTLFVWLLDTMGFKASTVQPKVFCMSLCLRHKLQEAPRATALQKARVWKQGNYQFYPVLQKLFFHHMWNDKAGVQCAESDIIVPTQTMTPAKFQAYQMKGSTLYCELTLAQSIFSPIKPFCKRKVVIVLDN